MENEDLQLPPSKVAEGIADSLRFTDSLQTLGFNPVFIKRLQFCGYFRALELHRLGHKKLLRTKIPMAGLAALNDLLLERFNICIWDLKRGESETLMPRVDLVDYVPDEIPPLAETYKPQGKKKVMKKGTMSATPKKTPAPKPKAVDPLPRRYVNASGSREFCCNELENSFMRTKAQIIEGLENYQRCVSDLKKARCHQAVDASEMRTDNISKVLQDNMKTLFSLAHQIIYQVDNEITVRVRTARRYNEIQKDFSAF